MKIPSSKRVLFYFIQLPVWFVVTVVVYVLFIALPCGQLSDETRGECADAWGFFFVGLPVLGIWFLFAIASLFMGIQGLYLRSKDG